MANTATQTVNFYAGGKPLHGTYTESIESNVFRTPMEGGIAKTAKKKGKTAVKHSMTYLYSTAELAAFKAWFKTTVHYGARFFNYPHPITDDIIDARIADGTYNVSPVNQRANYFYVQINFEVYE